jgi:UDPglucose 6-dehydrogenase
MRVSVLGLGKLGSPIAAVFASAGHEVLGCDINESFVEAINLRRAPVEETGLQKLLHELPEGQLRATTDPEMAAAWGDISFMVVPTPSDETGRFSNKYIADLCIDVGRGLSRRTPIREDPLVVLVSTVMPGTMERVVIPALEKHSGRKCGEDFSVAYNPEFIALGSVTEDLRRPDFVLVGAWDSQSAMALREFYMLTYRQLHGSLSEVPPICLNSLVNAEIAKLALNCYVTTKISYANMLGDLCEKIPGADATEVCSIIGHDRRIGHHYLKPATAFGGPCFPRDTRALIAAARDCDVSAPLCRATEAVNDSRHWRLANQILAYQPKRIAILGLSYKPDTAVIDESAAMYLMLALRGADDRVELVAYDPAVPDQQCTLEECLKGASVVVIMTAWDEFKGLSFSGATVVFDMWRVLDLEKQGEFVTVVYPGQHQDGIDE